MFINYSTDSYTCTKNAELAVVLSCLINTECKIEDDSTEEVETFKNSH